jgi:hypothetical protein
MASFARGSRKNDGLRHEHFERPLSLAAIPVALSPHPKIPFLADKLCG